MGAFELLSEDIRNVLDDLGIEEETRPQQNAIPPILDKKNTLVIAPTGIGKTEAAVLPILDNILKGKTEDKVEEKAEGREEGREGKGEGFKVLYITPLKALNRDMVQRMSEFAKRLDVRVSVRHGDTGRSERRKQSLNPPEFLVTTPETLQIMFTGRRLREGLKRVEYVVVDELNELAVDERGSQLSLALERLCVLTGREFQRVGLSATVGSPEKVLDFLTGEGREGVIVKTEVEKTGRMHVEYPKEKKRRDKGLADKMRCDVRKATDVRRCRELIDSHDSTLFFVNTRDSAEILASCFNMWDEDYDIGVHHGSLSKESRIEVENRFREGGLKALICTSSMELGIDLGNTDFVLQYQSPRQVTRWVQRLGRSGHEVGGRSEGTVISTNMDDISEAAVIARRALAGELEETDIPEKPISVLANQIISTVHSEKRVDVGGFYEMAKRAYPFRRMERSEFDELIEQLAEIRVIWKDDEKGEIGKRRSSLKYFYDNISMIPDEKTFLMKNMASGGIIGTLDESFVANQVEIGGVVTLQGKAWRIIDIEDNIVVSNPVGDIGKIPDWSGEDIPVPLEVAQEVGRLREKGDLDDWDEEIVDVHTKKKFRDYMKEQYEFLMPTDERIVIEFHDDTCIINSCFGSKVNETLGRLMAALLSTRIGESVGLQTDPYRIMMKISRRVRPEMVREVLFDTNPEHVKDLLKKAMGNSSFFRWRFLHVAKKFGAVKKDVDYRHINLDRLIETFEGSPLYREAVDKTLRDNMDLYGVKRVLEGIHTGEIEIGVQHGISPIAEAGLEKHKEFLSPDRVSHAVLMSFKDRLESEEVIMKCLKCRTRRRKRVRDVDKPSCPMCGSAMVVPLRPYQDEKIVDKKGEKLTGEEKKKLKEYYKLADLARVYKHRAVMALAARGVGHQKAGRILGDYYREEDDFLRALLRAEILYARTKRFWD